MRFRDRVVGSLLREIFCNWGVIYLPTLEYGIVVDEECIRVYKVVKGGAGLIVLSNSYHVAEEVGRRIDAAILAVGGVKECKPGWVNWGECNGRKVCMKRVKKQDWGRG